MESFRLDRGPRPVYDANAAEQTLSSARLRIDKDLEEIAGCPSLEDCFRLHLPIVKDEDGNYILTFDMAPKEGYFVGATFGFKLMFRQGYPHSPPRLRALSKVFHPNIDPESGGVCLNVLREDWSPVLSLRAVLLGLLNLFLEPSGEDPLNQEAGDLLKTNPQAFRQRARESV